MLCVSLSRSIGLCSSSRGPIVVTGVAVALARALQVLLVVVVLVVAVVFIVLVAPALLVGVVEP